MTDRELLSKYAAGDDQGAFAGLAARHGDWVYSCARRLVRRGDLAEDVAQGVFILLAKKARQIKGQAHLAGWLFRATQYCAREAMRSEARRQKHEREAAMRQAMAAGGDGADWEEIWPVLDEAVDKLGSADREAVLLRFYQGLSVSEVAAALGTGEAAAKKRVQRALEKLRGVLAKKGVVAGAGALGVVMAEKVTAAAPAGLVEAATKVAMGAAVGGGTGSAGVIAKGAMKMMAWAKMKVAAGLLGATLVGVSAIAVLPNTPATQPATRPVVQQVTPAPASKGEYYVGGLVPRTGVYSLSDGPVTLNQALASSGFDLGQNQSMQIDLLRRDAAGDGESILTTSVSQLRGAMDITLQDRDQLVVQPSKPVDRPITPVDHLQITIQGLVAPNVPTTLMKYADRQGQVHLPLVPAVQLKGLSCDDAGKAIAKAYSAQNLLRNAVVTVVRDDIVGAWFPLGPIQPGESLRVRIFDLPGVGAESSLNLIVSAVGDVELPQIKPVRVAGLKDYEAEEAIAEAYKSAHILRVPVLAVERPGSPIPIKQSPKTVADPAKPPAFSIVGDVPQPGQYALNWREHPQASTIMTSLELSRYDTATEDARARLIVLIHSGGHSLTFRTVGELLDRPDSDVVLQDGDLVIVSDAKRKPNSRSAGRYYISGVARSGAYGVAGPLLVRQALISAGYRPEDGDYLTRLSPPEGLMVVRITEMLKYAPDWLEVSPGEVLCVCRDSRSMVPPPLPATNPSANP